MERNIRFSFEGKEYEVSAEAYSIGYISLPDGRVLGVEGWIETMPPKPWGFHEIKTAIAREITTA